MALIRMIDFLAKRLPTVVKLSPGASETGRNNIEDALEWPVNWNVARIGKRQTFNRFECSHKSRIFRKSKTAYTMPIENRRKIIFQRQKQCFRLFISELAATNAFRMENRPCHVSIRLTVVKAARYSIQIPN